jgi:predicted nucleic acid-binding protein
VDVALARRWGQLSATLGHDGADLLIAATALEHGLTVVTRNMRHFEPTGVAVLNPAEQEI